MMTLLSLKLLFNIAKAAKINPVTTEEQHSISIVSSTQLFKLINKLTLSDKIKKVFEDRALSPESQDKILVD
jgi:hypothetical protein